MLFPFLVLTAYICQIRGPLSKLTSMIPGMTNMMGGGNEEEAAKKMRRIAFIFDSMTAEELDSDGKIFRDPLPVASGSGSKASSSKAPSAEPDMSPREPNKRVLRVARGSGTSVNEVEDLLTQHVMLSGMAKSMGGKTGMYVHPLGYFTVALRYSSSYLFFFSTLSG